MELGDLIANYSQSLFSKSNFKRLLDTRQKEMNTIQDIIYQEDYLENVHRLVGFDSNSCLSKDQFVVLYELDILPGDSTLLGKLTL